MTAPTAPEDLDLVAESLSDPEAFAEGILGHTLWPMQREILRAVAIHPKVAVKACHASSKTFSAAELVLWWITNFEDGVAVTTAPTDRQVENLAWREIRNAVERSAIKYPPVHKKKLEISEKNYAFGMSTRSDATAEHGVRFQGIHSRNVLIVLDEAMGIPQDTWDAIEGIRAGGRVHEFALANPTHAGGAFFDCFHSLRNEWKCFTIDAFDTPNLKALKLLNDDGLVIEEKLLSLPDTVLDANPFPYLVTRRWVRDRYLAWVGIGGVENESPRWLGRVRGLFPKSDPYQLIWGTWIDEANAREVPEPTGKRFSVGIDVAGEGESETVLHILDHGRIVHMLATTKPDPLPECAALLETYRKHIGVVNVDGIGVGYGFGLELRRAGYNVNLVNVGEASPEERYIDLKAYAYWQLRDAFRTGRISNLEDETTMAQLATLRTLETPKGKTQIEDKRAMRRRGAKSPDRAESLMLAHLAEHYGGGSSFTVPETLTVGMLRTRRSMKP